jgi:hypothetical protein
LAWIVGWTSQLDYIVNELTLEELRRLISVSVKLWKERGTEPALVDVLYLATGARCRALNWFDFRWILGEDYIGEEWDGLDSWLISLPGEDARAEYLSNLRIVDDGDLNRRLVDRLVELMRALGERWEVTYLAFLDLFTEPGDLTQWDLTDGTGTQSADGAMELYDESTVRPIIPIDERSASYYLKVQFRDTGTPPSLQFTFLIDLGSDAKYMIDMRAEDDPTYPSQIFLLRYAYDDSSTVIGSVDLHLTYPIELDVWYGLRVTVVDDEVQRVFAILLDGSEVLRVVDTDPSSYSGSFEITLPTDDCELYFDEVEVMLLPTPDTALQVLSADFSYFSGAVFWYLTFDEELTYYSGTSQPAFRKVGDKLFLQSESTHRAISPWSEQAVAFLNTQLGLNAYSNVVLDPKGNNDGDRFTEQAITSEHYAQSINYSAQLGYHYVFMFHIQPLNRDNFEFNTYGTGIPNLQIRLDTTTNPPTITFPSSPSGVPDWSYVDEVEGWVRLAFGVDAAAASTFSIRMNVCNSSWTKSYLGVLGYGLNMWGNEIQRHDIQALASYIHSTSSTPVERSYDRLDWSYDLLPEWMNVAPAFALEVIFHEYTSAMFEASAVNMHFWGFPGSDAILCYMSTSRTIVVWSAVSGILVETDPVTWDWNQRVEIKFIGDDDGDGKLVVSGFLTGNGTYIGDPWQPEATASFYLGYSGYYGYRNINALIEACPRRVYI